MKLNGILVFSIVLMIILSGCIYQQTQNTASDSDNQGIAVGEPNPSTGTPVKGETDDYTPPADDGKMMKPDQPEVSINDQSIESDTVTAEFVYIEQDGWLVIHADNDGKPGSVVGFTAIKEGLTDAVQVQIDSLSATETLYAMLHADTGVKGEYDFPDADAPITVDEMVVMTPFTVSNLPVVAEPEPTVQPVPIVAAKEFSIIADEEHFDPATISVTKGEQVRITFNFNDDDIYFGGLDIKSQYFTVNYRKDKGTTSATVEFTADQTFDYIGYWPASGVKKATGTVEVK